MPTFSLLKPFIEEQLEKHLDILGPDGKLKEACSYALLSGGKRLRPTLVFAICRALGKRDATKAALATEFFHVATLVADDLPCMDDDEMRRGKPSTHVVYGESVAILVTYALISAGFELIAQNAGDYGLEVLQEAIFSASKCTGICGVSGGQYLDLNPPDKTLPCIRQIIEKKTVALFEMSFVLGWLFGGGDLVRLPEVKKAAYHFGMAFQIADDIDDMTQDGHGALNLANTIGLENAIELFHVEQMLFQASLKELKLESKELEELLEIVMPQQNRVRKPLPQSVS